MLTELFLFYQVIALILFFVAFYTKNEIVWALTAVFTAFVMVSAFNVQTYVYVYNVTTSAYDAQLMSQNYSYLSWLNIAVFGLVLVFGIYDVVTKYVSGRMPKE